MPQQEPSHLSDSRVLGALFASREMKDLFGDRAMVQAWLDAEVALVEAQAECDVAPVDAARTIRARARAEELDLEAIASEVERTAHPLVPVIRALAERSGEAGAWVHYGATTQDIVDTGLVLQCRGGLELIEQELCGLIDVLAGLAERHRDLVMVGRTHAQHALPITLGFKFAVLLAEAERHLERVRAVRPRVLVGQLGGAVGSMAAFGARGPEVARAMMDRLDLGTADIAWHTSRDNLAELTSVLAMVAATCGKIANEVRVLQRTEVAELEEAFQPGKVGSSTMPHKRNPMFAEYIVSGALLCRSAPGEMLAAMVQEHERDMTMWGVEWTAVPATFVRTAGVLERTSTLLDGLVVHPEAMYRNLHLLGDLLLSEAAMMHLAAALGHSEAHEVVSRASMASRQSGRTLRDTLLEDPEVSPRVDAEELDALLVPESYVGSCAALVDRVVAHHRRRRAEDLHDD